MTSHTALAVTALVLVAGLLRVAAHLATSGATFKINLVWPA